MCDLDLLGTELLEFSTCNTDIPKALRFSGSFSQDLRFLMRYLFWYKDCLIMEKYDYKFFA